jgi:ADP-heptose:LPS heptosyltransferase
LKTIKHLLVVRNDRFGEFLLNIPAIRALKEKYPKAKLSLAVNSEVCQLAEEVECVDEVFDWDKIKSNLRKYKFDLCVILNPTKEAHWVVFRAGIPMRVSYDRKLGFLLTHKLKDTKHLGDRHEVDCNLELVNLLGAKTIDKTIRIKVSDDLYKEFIGKKIIAIHPFTSDPVKQWPVERFKELARRIRDELKLGVLMVGLTRSAVDAGSGIVNMINRTSLPELAALLKRCSLLVSCDSGPVHLAVSVGTQVIVLFRNDLPGKTAKRWGPLGKGNILIEKSNLKDISTDEVFNKVKEALNK